jgi:AcrR family transcriptional regulator
MYMPEEMSTETASKGERTRQVILDAAYSLIIEQGYAATSMRQIAERAELALGSIYNHFASKDEVFRAIIAERHPFLEVIPLLNSVEGNTVEEFVHNAAHTLIDELGHHPDFLNLMLIEIVEFKGEHVPLVFGKVFPMILPLAQRLAGLDGRIRKIPPPVLMRAFLGMFFSYYITNILIGPVMPPEMQAGALDYFVEIFLHGILVEKENL